MMYTNNLVSVIVPVYNVEKYIDRCVTSIVSQTYSNLEIILVDDGSIDSSGVKCDYWAKKDSRIKVIHKKNGGLGYARNSGLDIATGTYVSFIDSDDYIKTNAYEELVDRITTCDADAVYFGCNYDVNGIITTGQQKYPESCFFKTDIYEKLLPLSFGASIEKKGDEYGVGSVCCAFFRRSVIEDNKLRFSSERKVLSEDYIFTSKLLVHTNVVCFSNGNYYYYFSNENSLSHSYREDRFEKSIKFYEEQNKIIDKYNLGEKAKTRARYSFLINSIVCVKQEANRAVSYKNKKAKYLEISNSVVYRKIFSEIRLNSLNIKKRLLFMSLFYKWPWMVDMMGRKK